MGRAAEAGGLLFADGRSLSDRIVGIKPNPALYRGPHFPVYVFEALAGIANSENSR